MRPTQVRGWPALVALMFLIRPGWCAAPGTDAFLQGAQFVKGFTAHLADHFDRQLAPIQSRLATKRALLANTNDAGLKRALEAEVVQLEQQVKALRERKRLAAGDATAWKVFNATKQVHDVLLNMEGRLGQADTWGPETELLRGIASDKLARARAALQKANLASDYTKRLVGMWQVVNNLDNEAPTPQTRKMVGALQLLCGTLSQLGDLAPVVGGYLKLYGDVAGKVVAASARLAQKIDERGGRVLDPARFDDGRCNRLISQLRADGMAGADESVLTNFQCVPGSRDIWELPGSNLIVVWDAATGYWDFIRGKGLTGAELLRRYAFLATYTREKISLNDVVYWPTVPERTIGVMLEPDRSVVEPGGKANIRIYVARMSGGEALVSLSLRSRPVRSLLERVGAGPGPGTLSQLGYTSGWEDEAGVQWTAPEAENYVFRITASIASAESEYELVGKPYCEVATGFSTQIRLQLAPPQVEPGEQGQVRIELLNGAGEPLTGQLGAFRLTGEGGLQITNTTFSKTAAGKATATFTAPQMPGQYLVRADFSGYVDAGWLWGCNAVPSSAQAMLTVREKREQPPPAPPEPRPDPVEPDEEPQEVIKFDRPMYLVHIIQTSTRSGPREEDSWSLFSRKPENDHITTPDGWGGVYHHKTRECLGPFSSSTEVLPVLNRLGVDGVEYKNDWIGQW